MMMLLPMLALAMPVDDTPHQCTVERGGPDTGSYNVSGVFPSQDPGRDFVIQTWTFKRGRLSVWLEWFSPAPEAPKDTQQIGLTIRGIPKGVEEVRGELWRDGRRISEQTGPWTSLRGKGFRELAYWPSIGTLRALAQTGPVTVAVVDRDGEMVANVVLPPALIETPTTLALSARGDFAVLAAAPAERCPVYQEPEIVVT